MSKRKPYYRSWADEVDGVDVSRARAMEGLSDKAIRRDMARLDREIKALEAQLAGPRGERNFLMRLMIERAKANHELLKLGPNDPLPLPFPQCGPRSPFRSPFPPGTFSEDFLAEADAEYAKAKAQVERKAKAKRARAKLARKKSRP